MAENTKIEWADHTFNPWIGCTRVSRACQICYAEDMMDTRFGRVKWGPKGKRSRTSAQYWKDPYRWNKAAYAELGRQARVFCASLADVFDDHPSIQDDWRWLLWKTVVDTQNLEWLLLTKRPENWPQFLPCTAPQSPYENIRLGVTIEDNDTLEKRGPLLAVAASIGWPTFVSYEPAAEIVDFEPLMQKGAIGWLICGGASGPDAYDFDVQCARNAIAAGRRHNVPVHIKQLGAKPISDGTPISLEDPKGGDMSEWSDDLRVREFPAERSVA